MTQIERLEFKAAFETDDVGNITGKAWDFNTPDRVGDDIRPEAFAGAIGKAIPMMAFHDQSQTIGVWDSLSIESDGLQISGKLLVGEVARADELRALVKAKAVTGLSIGFKTTKSAPRTGGGRTIIGLELLECSLVAIPAHPDARISNMKELHMPELKTVEALELEIKAANDNIESMGKRLEEAETKLARPAIHTLKEGELTSEQKAFRAYLRLTPQAHLSAEDQKTLTVSSDPAGGYLAPKEMTSEFIRNLVQFSPLRQFASVRSTSSPSVIYPSRTSVTNALWKGETQAQTGSEPTFGQIEVPVCEINTFVDLSNQLLADSGGVAESEVRLALEEDFGQKEAAAFLTGSGANQPKGLLTETAISTVAAGAAATISFDDLLNLYYSLPAAYRKAGTWGMNTNTLKACRKLKDLNGQYIWQPPVAIGEPSTIFGRPVMECLEMDDIGTTKTSVVYGDMTGYRIVDRVSMSILVNPFLLATNGITRFHATRRVGGGVLQPAKFKKLLHP